MAQQRIMSVDYLRVVLAGFVVVAHSGLGRETVGLTGLAWGNSVLRVAVPVFAIIAGYFLSTTLRRGRLAGWAGHLLMVYAGWSAIYLLFLWPYYTGRPIALTLGELASGFMHLWFLLGLAASRVMLAGFRALGPHVVIGSALTLAAAGLALQYAAMAGLMLVPVEQYRNGPLYLYPYLAMGWLMAHSQDRLSRVPGAGLWGLAATGLALSVAESTFWLRRIGEDPLLELPAGHLLLCPALFLLAQRWRLPATDLPLGRAAAGIYVMHVLVLQGLPMLGISHPLAGVTLGIALPFLLVCAVSSQWPRHRGLAGLL